MKKITKQLTAILTAAIMTVSLAGTAYADETPTEAETATADTEAATVSTEAAKYTGWKLENGSWYYFTDGEMQTSQRLKIDGVMHSFSERGTYMGKYSGSATENGKSRYYSDGLPIYGWIEVNNEKRYCLDGYSVNGEFPVDGMLYKFNGKGVYTGSSRTPEVSATCGERVCTDAEKLTFTIENLDGKSHEFKIAQSFEYFKDGEWANCKNGTVKYQSLKNGLSKKGEKLSFEVSTREYSKNKFNSGFYRLPIECGTETYYAVFEVVNPIELKSPKEEYVIENYYEYNRNNSTTLTDFVLTINSEKKDMQAENIAGNISIKIEKQTENGWEALDGVGLTTGYTDDKNRLEVVSDFIPEVGYYRATVTVNGAECTEYFFISYHTAKAWFNEYDLNNKDLTVCFNVQNRGGEPIKICTLIYQLYKKENGEWKYIDNHTAFEISLDSYKTLKAGERMALGFDLSACYDVSKLEAGEYAADIGGIGFGEFTLTDKPKERNFPFKNLNAEDIKEIQIENVFIDLVNTAVLTNGNSETTVTDVINEYGWREITAQVPDSDYFNNAVCYIRQLQCLGKGKNSKEIDLVVGSAFHTKIILKDGTDIFLDFNGDGEVIYNDRLYSCSRHTYNALISIVEKFTQRNLPFDDIYDNEPIKIQFKKIDGGRIITAELNAANYDDLHSQVVYTHYFELKEACENYEIPTGGAFQVILIYKGGVKEVLTFYEPDIVKMPDGKIYRCYDSSYYDSAVEMFDKLEHTVKNIVPDNTLTEDTAG